jgi:anti-sigma regulatory factor (Ser/Thr protein kinase)/CheY-like chemotaxis protein
MDLGMSSISAIISDYRLPDESGTDFLIWARGKDNTISTVIITGQGEKSVVEESIAVGVYRYLEKPVTHQELREVIWSAVERTRLQRKYILDQEGLQAVEHLGQSLNVVIPESLQKRMAIFYQPLQEVGGDFLITQDLGNGRLVFLVGDISGHDIRSGYMSTYFQGMFRGSLQGDGEVSSALELFNRSLRQQILKEPGQEEPVSLALSALDFCEEAEFIRHWNFGFTPCLLVSETGSISECPFGRFPLGWMEEIDTKPVSIPLIGNSILYIFTDGLVDFANSLGVNHFCLLYRMLRSNNLEGDLPESPTDDILIVRYLLNPTMPLSQTFEPILSEHYSGSELEHIDQLQANWRRCITFALGDRLGDRLYDLLICIREGMINALTHGCEGDSDKFAHLQISINDEKDLLRVFIDDPGRGHSFNLGERLQQLGERKGKHLGLGIIQHLSDELHVENKGTSLVFDFEVNPNK